MAALLGHVLVACIWFVPGASEAGTVVKLGSVRQISGPQDLDLEGEIIYAINFSQDDPVRTVRGVAFLPDRQKIVGATLVGPQQVAPWQTKPEFGASSDANQLEEIFQDIRWANSGASERLRATLSVTAGEEYKLQVLISGNNAEDRRWDIRVNGTDAVDEITSLGVAPGQSYARNRATLYTYQFTPPTNVVVVEMGNLFGNHDGGDRNPIWQGLTLERVFVPPAPEDIVLEPSRFFPTQTAPIGRLRAIDRRGGVVHSFAFVPGAVGEDNAKFTLSGADVLARPFDFSTQPVGSTYSIRVSATDLELTNRILEKSLTVSIAAPHGPPAPVVDATSISTLAQPGMIVARLRADDLDAFDRHVFELVAGPGADENAVFTISGSELLLAKPFPPGLAQVRIRVRATDLAGLASEAALVLAVAAPRVLVSELIAGQLGGVPDEALEPQEWIELHNPLPQWVGLTGFYLSDDPDNLAKWRFPSGVIPPNGYLVILADGRGVSPDGSPLLHGSFSLDSAGEWVGLVRPDGATIADELKAPAFFPGISYGIGNDGRPGHLSAPTPGTANGPVAEYGENEVIFSAAHGFYAKSFPLELAATVPGSTIRYTVDGSRPTATSGTVYSSAVSVTPSTSGTTRGTRIIRAIAVHPRAAYAAVKTQTYLFINGSAGPLADGVVGQSQLLTSIKSHATYGPLLDDALLALPAVSVILPQGPNTTERLASLELFDPQKQEDGFQIDCGINSTGTTSLGSPKLSMAAKFRAQYGRSKLRYPVFARGSLVPSGAATEFKELRLRSHSHDTFFWLGTRENPPVPYGSPPVTRSGDAQLARNLWIDEMQLLMGQPGKRGRQVHLFLNGSYHGIYHLHEHADEDFMASYLPGSSADFHSTAAATTGSDHGGGDSWTVAWSALKASLANYAQAKRWIDVTNLCDYMVLSFYAGNDWDWWERHNWAAAGPKSADRGGWKFFQQDSDICLQDVAADCTDQAVPDGIFGALMRFSDFRVLFRDRVYQHCFNGGALTRAGAVYEARMNEISTAIIAETARWQPGSSVAALPWDRDQEWTNEWKYLRNTFFPQRTARLIQQLRLHPSWWPVEPPELSRLGGSVPAGYQLTFSAPVGAVYFTTDGSDPRLPGGGVSPTARRVGAGITDTVLIPAGAVWRFLDDATEPAATWKEHGFDDSSWQSGATEIGYGDGGEVTVARFVDTDPVTAGIQKNITTYFRKSFDAPNLTDLKSLKVRLVRDDGAVVYLNGVEIWRSNMPDGVITSLTPAAVSVGGADESAFFELTLNANQVVLQPASNVLAVEVHQQGPASSDISFDLELIASVSDANSNTNLTIDAPTLVKARAYSGADWSPLVEAFLVSEGIPPASASNLILAEIQYHPLDETGNEFLEFLNTSSGTLDLSDVAISEAVRFQFPRPTVLAVGERIAVAKDTALFEARYRTNTSPYHRNGVRVVGPWLGSLSNDGESIQIVGADGTAIFSCTYGTTGSWPGRADGKGSSLELIDPTAAPFTSVAKSAWLGDPQNWRPSTEFHGSPGASGTGPDSRLVINELLAAPLPQETDAVELKNMTGGALDLSGWFLSDSAADYRKFRFPDGTRIEAGARLVLRESDFNNLANLASLVPFAFDDAGETIYLVEGGPDGALLRFVDWIEYGPVPDGVALGRWPDGTGPVWWLETSSLGAANGPPVPGYAAWVAATFAPGTPADVTEPAADPDGDGIINSAEYAFVLSPLRPGPGPLKVAGIPGQGGFTFSYRTRTGAADLDYRVGVSPDLVNWDESGASVETLAQTPLPDGSTVVVARLRPSVEGGAASRFVRVSAVP